jgi:hypothetical protein
MRAALRTERIAVLVLVAASVFLLALSAACAGRWVSTPYAAPQEGGISLEAVVKNTGDALFEMTGRDVRKFMADSWIMRVAVANNGSTLLVVDPRLSSVVLPSGQALQLSALFEEAYTTAIPPRASVTFTLPLKGMPVRSGDLIRLYLVWTTSGGTTSAEWTWRMAQVADPSSTPTSSATTAAIAAPSGGFKLGWLGTIILVSLVASCILLLLFPELR